ncbi:unnamed protein product [Closterium sp. NIES-54]
MASRSSSLLVSRPPHALASSQSPIFHPRTPCSAPAPLRSPRAKPARLIVSPAACRLSPTRPVATNEFSGASSRASSRNRRQRRNVSRAGIFNGWRAPPAESSIGAETTRRNAPDGAGGIVAQGERDGEGAGARGAADRRAVIPPPRPLVERAATARAGGSGVRGAHRRPRVSRSTPSSPTTPPSFLPFSAHLAPPPAPFFPPPPAVPPLPLRPASFRPVLFSLPWASSSLSAFLLLAPRPSCSPFSLCCSCRSHAVHLPVFPFSPLHLPPPSTPLYTPLPFFTSTTPPAPPTPRRMRTSRYTWCLWSRWTTQEERGESMLSFAREVALRSTKAIVRATAARPLAPNLGPLRRALLWAARFVPMPLVGLLVIEGVCAPEGPGSSALVKGAEFQALLNLDLSSALKVVLARQITLDTLDGAAGVMASSVIIGERNRACMQEVHEALKAGSRRIAVFYGSGHLPDMHLRLTTELGLEPSDLSWRTAWSIPTPAFAPLPAPPPPASSAAPPSDVNSVSAASTAASAAAAAGSSAAAAASPLGLPALPRPASRRTSPSLANPTMFSSANPTTTTPPTSPSSSIPTFHSPHLTHLSKQAHGLLDKSLSHLAGATGWPMTRQQTAALLLLSVVLALDLCLWEVVLASLSDLAVLLLGGVGQFLDQGWGLGVAAAVAVGGARLALRPRCAAPGRCRPVPRPGLGAPHHSFTSAQHNNSIPLAITQRPLRQNLHAPPHTTAPFPGVQPPCTSIPPSFSARRLLRTTVAEPVSHLIPPLPFRRPRVAQGAGSAPPTAAAAERGAGYGGVASRAGSGAGITGGAVARGAGATGIRWVCSDESPE